MESPETWFHRRATLYVETQILFHLNQVGVWDLLSRGEPLTTSQIANSLGLELAPTDALLDYVFGVDELLQRDEQGKYSLSEFGESVVSRFSDMKADNGRQSINMFDVRVGAYGPVWHNLGGMLRGDARYGEDFHREGQVAANGVFKLAMRFWDSLLEHIEEFDATSALEVGLTTGLVEGLGERYPDRTMYGLDKNGEIIEKNAASASAQNLGNMQWIQSDFFDVDHWTESVDAKCRGIVYSLHFHELIAKGEDKFVDALRLLRSRLPNWIVLAFEQPRLPQSDRETLPESRWLYSQSNVLIHHLIGNGKILSRDAWVDLGARAGCPRVTDRACNFLGYRAFAFHL